MAEIVGLAASVIAIVHITEKIISYGYQYISGVNHAPTDIQELMDELSELKKVLIRLQDFIDKNPTSNALQDLNHQGGLLLVCAKELEKLETKLKPTGKWSWKVMQKRLKWPLKEKETFQQISRIGRYKANLLLALATDNIELSKEIETCVQDIQRGIRIESKAKTASRQVDDSTLAVEKLREVLDWIHPEPFDERHSEVQGMRQANTGGWLFERSQFKDWVKEQSNSRLLWGYGIPGAGKTFISSMVIDHLEARAKAANYGIVYVYFDYKEQDQQTPTRVLAGLVKQLACKLPNLPASIEALYDKLVVERRKPSLDELYVTLFDISKSFSRLFLIFDALDECNPEKQRAKLLPLFHRMAEDNGASLFITSRPHPDDIQDSFGNGAKIELLAQDQDIETYIDGKINENSRVKRLVSQGQLRSRIISDLTKCAKGMFLLVRFQVEYLCHQATTVNQILKELDRLKNSSATGSDQPLDPTYDRAMKTLRQQPKNCEELASRVLMWLVKARRTLSIAELSVAVSVEPNRYELEVLDLPDRATLLDVCAGLVMIDDDTKTVRLAHYTVQEYLVRTFIPDDAGVTVAIACTTYLSFDVFAEGACTSEGALRSRIDSYPFLFYAAKSLCYHLNNCSEDPLTDIVLKFLKSTGSRSSYLQATIIFGAGGENIRFFDAYTKMQTEIHVASSLAHVTALRKLLEASLDISATDKDRSTAPWVDANQGHEAILQLLLDKGVDIEARDSRGMTPLHMAREMAVAELLLGKGADIGARDNIEWTPLHRAAFEGETAMAELLLGKGADIEARGSDGWTPLHMAASEGETAVAELLLDKGADIEARDNYGKTPLNMVAFGGGTAVVELLLDKRANIEARDNIGWTPLHMAAFGGETAVAELLLDKGADIEARGNDGKTLLYIVAPGLGTAVAELLLSRGASQSDWEDKGKFDLSTEGGLGSGTKEESDLDTDKE